MPVSEGTGKVWSEEGYYERGWKKCKSCRGANGVSPRR